MKNIISVLMFDSTMVILNIIITPCNVVLCVRVCVLLNLGVFKNILRGVNILVVWLNHCSRIK